MKKLIAASVATCFVLIAGSGTVLAQNASSLVIPVELFTCNYNEGKGPADLDKIIVKWNSWADKTGSEDYSAWTLTPYYFGPDQEFDLIWLGAAKTAVALGQIQDAYLNENAGLQAGFAEVLSCDAHSNFASLNYKAAPDGASPKNSILTFSDCTYKEGSSFEAMSAAMGEWSQHLTNAGSEAAIFHWYPAFGGGGEEFSFKWLEAHENLASLGADYDSYGTGKGYEVFGGLFDDLIDCDSTRAYVAQNRRFVQLR
jgi:hypothetical protein